MVVCDSQRVYAEWADGRSGHNEIYFTSAPLSALGVQQPAAVTPATPVLGLPGIFRRHAELAVDLPVPQNIRLDVFDASGRIVKTLHAGRLPAGRSAFSLSDLPVNQALFATLTGAVRQTRKFIVLP
jgi:hypothetical protein